MRAPSFFPKQSHPPKVFLDFAGKIRYNTSVINPRRCVGMADEGDSKSLVLITRVGSTPTTGTKQAVRTFSGSGLLYFCCKSHLCVLRENADDGVGRGYLAGKIQMDIDIAGGADITVTEPLLNLLQAHAIGIEQTGAAMAQVVETDTLHLVCYQKIREMLTQEIGPNPLSHRVYMRVQHKPGDAIQVDWAGDTIPIYDSVTGQQSSAYLFVAVLPCSYYAYTEACADMKTENWLNCHVHAFNYFGGVARLLIPDNRKTATSFNTRYDTVMNRSYQELADYYSAAIVPARVRRPKDKSSAEASVRFAETWIVAALRDRKFFSLQEVNEAVAEKLEELNSREFQQRTGTRRSAYLEEEQPYMLPLPATPFESAV